MAATNHSIAHVHARGGVGGADRVVLRSALSRVAGASQPGSSGAQPPSQSPDRNSRPPIRWSSNRAFVSFFVAVQPWSGPRSCSGQPPKETLILFRSGLSAGSSTPDHLGALGRAPAHSAVLVHRSPY